jgi:hypothetical protein
MTEKHYKVIVQAGMKYIAMPPDAVGYYIRRVCQDGAVTFLPVTMPESTIVPPAIPVLDEKEMPK